MVAITNNTASQLEARDVLTKAVGRAAERLNISKALLAVILGLSPATITRLYNGEYVLNQKSKEWDFALLFVRAFRSLDSIVNNDETAKAWLNNQNNALNGKPIDLIKQTEGLVRVVHYLDTSRGIVWSICLAIIGMAHGRSTACCLYHETCGYQCWAKLVRSAVRRQ